MGPHEHDRGARSPIAARTDGAPVTQRCPRCGGETSAGAAYCARCGAALPAPGAVPPAHGSAQSRNWAVAAHLTALAGLVTGLPSLLGPLVVWLVKREEDAFVENHAREALNFNLSVLIYAMVSFALALVTLGLALLVLLPVGLAAFVGWLVLIAVAAGRAADGRPYRYPLTIRLVR